MLFIKSNNVKLKFINHNNLELPLSDLEYLILNKKTFHNITDYMEYMEYILTKLFGVCIGSKLNKQELECRIEEVLIDEELFSTYRESRINPVNIEIENSTDKQKCLVVEILNI